MGLGKGKIEKGSGGKRGQSGKDNWMTHQEEKDFGRRCRRIESTELEREAKSNEKDDT